MSFATPDALQANYTEGLLIGYRWYEKRGVAPAFPFGHGLTYGAFAYSALSIVGRTVSFNVTLTAGAGCDTPQLYLSYPGAAADPTMPVKALRGFQKVCGSSQQVSFVVSDIDVSRWDVGTSAWVVVHGIFGVSIGASSADVRLTGQMTV
jgi:beta-glucosidase